MKVFTFIVGLLLVVVLICNISLARLDADRAPLRPDRMAKGLVANPQKENRVHRGGLIWMNMTNWGYFGNFSYDDSDAMDDPEFPGEWAPQCEYPGGSRVQYLFQGALWIGAEILQEDGTYTDRVSVGTEGWHIANEFWPGEGEQWGIEERSTRENAYNRLGDYISHPDAVSEQDFIAIYCDTLTDRNFVDDDDEDGPHYPLGIKITQKSYSWSYKYAQDFIIIDYEIENIASNYLRNVYVGLYVDADCGWLGEGDIGQGTWHNDDICGFTRWHTKQLPDGSIDSTLIDVAWISDQDGRPEGITSGTNYTVPDVTGVRVLRAPNPRLRTSFNWWVSRGDQGLDFGPSWLDDGAPGGWTNIYGTPMGDVRKYFVLSNGEFDYNQIYVNDPDYIQNNPQRVYDRDTGGWIEHAWKIPGQDPDDTDPDLTVDLADGYDTRYLLSWGPLGVYDPVGRFYRLYPGEKFSMTIAYVAGANFHNPEAPQTDPGHIDPQKFDFDDFTSNALWAKKVYDNDMIDTPVYDWGNDHDPDIEDEDGSQGDGIPDTGDGWYGEDVGSDGLYAELPPGEDSVAVYLCFAEGDYPGHFVGWYTGPDPDGSEMNGDLDPGEDNFLQEYLTASGYDDGYVYAWKYSHYGVDWDIGYMSGNDILDLGDGIPDFQGPPPPSVPELTYETTEKEVILRWHMYPSQHPAKVDPFSRVQDFEGYRVWVGNRNFDEEYTLLAEIDKIDFAYYNARGSLRSQPVADSVASNLPPDSLIHDEPCALQPVFNNIGFDSIKNSQYRFWFNEQDSTYVFIINNAQPLYPRWYAVTAFDFGDFITGTEPLETAKSANAVYVAPSGTPEKPILVVPNPYRAYLDYTVPHSFGQSQQGLSWENQDDGTIEFYPQTDRRIEFINLPEKCLIRIFTVAGDLVAVVPHNIAGDTDTRWTSKYSEGWDLNNRNRQQVVSGLYLFSVEDYTEGNKGKMKTGKFVIIR